MTLLAVSLAGGAGAATRFVVDGAVRSRWPTLPWATLVINVTGSLLLGVLTGLALAGTAPGALAAVAGTGFCGGYTTMSTFSFETVRLVQQRRLAAAVGYAGLTLTLAVGAAALGLSLALR